MTILKTAKKGPYMNSSGNYYIQNITKQKLQFNNMQTYMQKSIFNVLLKYFKQNPPPPTTTKNNNKKKKI
jgi:hypothetical protein